MDLPKRDGVALAISLGMILAYQLYVQLRLRRDPGYTVHAVNRRARTTWVAHVMGSPSRALLGVQTLRNSTMAATFFATTAVLLMIGTLNLAIHTEELAELMPASAGIQQSSEALRATKVLLLVAVLFVAFFSFAMCVRLLNHVGYLINVPSADDDHDLAVRSAAGHVARAGTHYMVGMRAYFVAVPLVFWLFGPEYLVVSTVIVLCALFYLDRAPRSLPLPGNGESGSPSESP